MALSGLSRVKSVLWGNDSKDASLLIKLDFTILPYYATAYISGMKDDLHFKGKDFNYLNTTYLVVYAVCQMPGTSLLTIFPPKYIFVGANVAWSVLTLITFRMNHVWQLLVLNAFEGGFSAIA
jgi:MFS transporter, ACS family, pantothenate transporter